MEAAAKISGTVMLVVSSVIRGGVLVSCVLMVTREGEGESRFQREGKYSETSGKGRFVLFEMMVVPQWVRNQDKV